MGPWSSLGSVLTSLPVPRGTAVMGTASPVPRGPGWRRPRDSRMRLALVSPTHLALQHFQGSHRPPTSPHMEADGARPAGGPTWELARAAGGPRTLMPVSINMWVLVMVLETLTAPLMLCSLIFQGEERENTISFHHHPTGAWGKCSV